MATRFKSKASKRGSGKSRKAGKAGKAGGSKAQGGKCGSGGGSVLVYVLVAAAMLLIGVMAWQFVSRAWMGQQQQQQQQQRQFGGAEAFYDDAAQRPQKPEQQQSRIVFLHMDGCGWCERMRPEWDAFVQRYAAELARLHVTAVDYERADPAAAELVQHANGYPTVLFVHPDGTVVKFDGERTPEGLIAFIRGEALYS